MEIDRESAAKYVHKFYFNDLNWCGCGNPESAMVLMRDVLATIKRNSDEGHHLAFGSTRSREEFEAQYGEYKARIRSLIGEIGTPICLSYFYMLDAAELTEHGGGLVNGGWLTDKGVELLNNLQAVGDLEWTDFHYASEVTE